MLTDFRITVVLINLLSLYRGVLVFFFLFSLPFLHSVFPCVFLSFLFFSFFLSLLSFLYMFLGLVLSCLLGYLLSFFLLILSFCVKM